MNIEDLRSDVDEYYEMGDSTYAQALDELVYVYENESRELYYEKQGFHNIVKFPDYPKVNL